MGNDISIYVCGHKPFPVPPDPIYKRLQLGAALHEDLGYIRDDSGDNISELNPFFSELTGMYWIWRNDHDSDIKGLCHYRRYFIDEEGNPLNRNAVESFLNKGDVITSNMICFDKSCKEAFIEAHNAHDLAIVEEALKHLYPSYGSYFDSVFEDDKNYFANLCCMKSELFDAYSGWLFSILFEASEKIDLTGYDAYQTRAYGFYAERLLRVWIEGSGLKAVPVRVGYTAEKSENTDLKSAVSFLIGQGKIKEAEEIYRRVLRERPDMLLPASDIDGSLVKLAEILKSIKEIPEKQSLYLNVHSFEELLKRSGESEY